MKRRNFIGAVLGGLAMLPLVKNMDTEPSKPKPVAGEWSLTHRESRSGLRCTDVRLVLDDNAVSAALSKQGEQVLLNHLKKIRYING